MVFENRYTFLVQWNDLCSSILRKFNLFFYPDDGTLELFDVLKHRLFLKRTKCNGIAIQDLFIGSTLCICSRLICITGYGDSYTKTKFEIFNQKTCGFMALELSGKKGELLDILIKNNFKIIQLGTIILNSDDVRELYNEFDDDTVINELIDHLTNTPVTAFQLLGNNAVERLSELAGPANFEEAKKLKPESLRAIYGIDNIHNGLYVSTSKISVEKDFKILFKHKPFAFLKNTTSCVIKPHAIKEGKAGEIMDMIEKSGYEITSICTCILSVEESESFYEIYKYILPQYQDMVQELCSGLCYALEIRPTSEKDSIEKFRHLVGPLDLEMAKILRPETIRAKFGRSSTQNAVHVTDLTDDAVREVEFFLRLCME